ncbi:MAG: PAS domain S-box protein, partial [Firmicutes bacterium]|nr:PAS domain S-box protein [Bacillota bacterium]
MTKLHSFRKVIQDMSLLYELALVTGQSLDLRETCDVFLKRLMGRKNLKYSAVWIKDNYLTGEDNKQVATLVYAFPEYLPKTKKIFLDHPLFNELKGRKYIAFPATEDKLQNLLKTKRITKGTFVLFLLDEIGLLMLFSTRDDFSSYELNQLDKVISKFAYSLRGCLFHSQLLREMKERKKAVQALKRSQQQMAEIINFLPDATFAVDLQGRVISWNHAIETMTGIRAEEMLGKGNYEYALPFWGSRKPILIDFVLNPSLMKPFEKDYLFLQRLKDNSTIGELYLPTFRDKKVYLWCKATPLLDHEGEVAGAIESMRDVTENKLMQKELVNAYIELEKRVQKRTAELAEANKVLRSEITDRKRIEAELAKEKELLSVTFHSITDGVITTDILGNVTSANPAAESITGWKQEEALGRPIEHIFQIIIDEKIYKISRMPLKDLLKRNKMKHMVEHIKFLDRNKERKIIFANAAPIKDKAGGIIGYVIVFRDITRQKKFEAQLALSQKLQSIGELAAGIAHEINTPMQYIGDNTRFLQNTINDIICDLLAAYQRLKDKLLAGESTGQLVDEINKKEQKLDIAYLSQEVPNALRETLEGIEKVNKLVLAMKDFAHPGKKEKKPADINKAIKSTVTISRNEWKYISKLETDLEPGLPLVHCVIGEINQVLLNMIVNAVQAIEDAQKKKPIKGKIKINTKSDGDHIKILISVYCHSRRNHRKKNQRHCSYQGRKRNVFCSSPSWCAASIQHPPP